MDADPLERTGAAQISPIGTELLPGSTHGSFFVDHSIYDHVEVVRCDRAQGLWRRRGVSASPGSYRYNYRLYFQASLYKRISESHSPLPHLILRTRTYLMQGPTLTDTRVRNTVDSHVIFEAVAQRVLPLITRRLTSIERREYIRPGSVFVWEERGPESGSSGVSRRGPPLVSDSVYTDVYGKYLSSRLNVGQMVNIVCALIIILAYEISHGREIQ